MNIFLLISITLAVAEAGPLQQWKKRIYGGENVAIEKFPYQVSIEQFGKHNCGGSIISKYYVLTAAHCVGGGVEDYTIRVSSTFREQGGRVHKIEKIILHEYKLDDAYKPVNDIALVKVATPFEFDDTCKPIELFNSGEKVPDGVPSIATGWGLTEKLTLSHQLKMIILPIVNKDLCKKYYSGLPEGQICAGLYGKGGKDTCQSDSGGPLMIDGRLAGVVSWGYECGSPTHPGVYTEVAYYRDWIAQHVAL